MGITIKDVAKRADVSISTVSLVVNNNPLVKHETRTKVLAAIEELGYTPNQNARALITKVKKVIGVIKLSDGPKNDGITFDSTAGTYFTEMIWSIEAGIAERGFSMVLDWHNVQEDGLPKVIDSNRVDGIICVGGIVRDKFVKAIKETGIPTVLVGARSQLVDYVDTDVENAIYMSAKYMIEMGHRRIAFLNGPEISQGTERKHQGFLQAVHEAGLTVPGDCVIKNCQYYSGKAAYESMADLWRQGERPTAIVAAADNLAVGAMRFLSDNRIGCPQEVSVIGYEDGLVAEYAIPPLTTMQIEKEMLGAEACNILFNRINNPKARKVGGIRASHLVVRGSTQKIK